MPKLARWVKGKKGHWHLDATSYFRTVIEYWQGGYPFTHGRWIVKNSLETTERKFRTEYAAKEFAVKRLRQLLTAALERLP